MGRGIGQRLNGGLLFVGQVLRYDHLDADEEVTRLGGYRHTGTAVSDKLGTGTFALSLSTNLAAATTHTGEHGAISCAPSTGTLSLTGATATNSAKVAATGKECTFTKAGGTLVMRAFFGRGTVTGAGTLASLTGMTARVLVIQKGSDSSVRGFVHVRSAFFHSGDNDNDGD